MAIIQVPDISDIFADDVITPMGIPTNELEHEVLEVRPFIGVQHSNVIALIDSLRSQVSAEHKIKTGEQLNYRRLGKYLQEIRERFWNDPKFKESLGRLGLDYRHHELIEHPWWNDRVAGEIVNYSGIVLIRPKHSLSFQMSRNGVTPEAKNIILAGIVQAKTEDTSNPEYVISLRGGDYYPNTFHSLISSVDITADLKDGRIKLYDSFERNVLNPRTGLIKKDLYIEDSHVLARIEDRLHPSVIYAFLIHSNLTADEIKAKWKHPDKKELFTLKHSEIEQFIKDYYVGKVMNNQFRPDNRRYLLHQGALVLAALIGMQPEDLKKLYKPGNH